ncbi:MAG: putative transporter [Terrimicrobiaceae bacterium]
MDTIAHLAETQPVAWAVLVFSAVAVLGLAFAGIKFRGVGLGIAGVLFAGILAGHAGVRIDHGILEFVREFGLILFVFTIGLQLGPSFFASLRQAGMKLNLLAAGIVACGVMVTIAYGWLTQIDPMASAGLFSGATTNTPALGAAQQTLDILQRNHSQELPADRVALPALAYAVGYPTGIFGIIGVMLFLKAIFRIDPEKEVAEFQAEQQRGLEPLLRMNLVMENPNLNGLPIAEIPGRRELTVAVSRIKRPDIEEVEPATEQTVIHTGDRILAIGTRNHLEAFRLIVGRESGMDLMKAPGRAAFRRVVVTRKEVLGKSIGELGLDSIYGVTITRVVRADVEMPATTELKLQFGDFLHVVGDEEHITKAADALGNSLRVLNQTNFIPIFLGILLGVAAGLVPFAVPGLPVHVRLGLAGGPLVLAILLARIGKIGPLVWFMPATANTALREMGIILFLASVGIKAGEKFLPTLLSSDGMVWLAGACAITILPLLIIGLVARLALRLNFVSLCGLLAGSMTDPPALAFANSIAKSDTPSVAYAAVYPLTMLLRIMAAQLIVLLCGR